MNYGAALRKLHIPLWQPKRVSIPLSDQVMLKEMMDKVQFTPDAPILERTEHQWVFLYGNLMRGRRDYKVIKENSTFRAHGLTENSYHMWKKKLGEESFPIALEKNDPWDATPYTEGDKLINKFEQNAYIKGELHKVDSSLMFELDKYFLNGVEFFRKQITIDIPTTRISSQGVTRRIRSLKNVWIYLGIPEYWYGMGQDWACYTNNKTKWDTIDHGFLFEPVKIYSGRPELPPYYYFATTEGWKD